MSREVENAVRPALTPAQIDTVTSMDAATYITISVDPRDIHDDGFLPIHVTHNGNGLLFVANIAPDGTLVWV